jgi:single-strand DNA-binding protein
MSFLAANPADLPHLSPCTVEQANNSLQKRNGGGKLRLLYDGHASRIELRFAANFRSQCADENSALGCVCRYVSRLLLGHSFGAFRRPAALGLLLRIVRPFGVSVPPKTTLRTTAKYAAQTSFGPLPESIPSALGSRAHSLSSAQCDPSNNGRNSTNGDTLMYQNKVTLIGFLGSNAEVRTNNNRSFTTLSLATKSSYKKDDKYISHTEWHRCVVFGKLSEFAKTLTKGAHIQVEGELRSREYESKKTDTKQRVWEIRVASILKLDRAEKAAPEDQDHDEVPQEETAA